MQVICHCICELHCMKAAAVLNLSHFHMHMPRFWYCLLQQLIRTFIVCKCMGRNRIFLEGTLSPNLLHSERKLQAVKKCVSCIEGKDKVISCEIQTSCGCKLCDLLCCVGCFLEYHRGTGYWDSKLRMRTEVLSSVSYQYSINILVQYMLWFSRYIQFSKLVCLICQIYLIFMVLFENISREDQALSM